MVAHQHVGVDGDAFLPRGDDQQLHQVRPVFIVHEDRAAIHAPLGDMDRNIRQHQTGASRHGAIVGGLSNPFRRQVLRGIVGKFLRLIASVPFFPSLFPFFQSPFSQ